MVPAKIWLLKHNTCVVDFDFADAGDHLMVFVSDIHAQALQFSNELLDLLFHRVAPHVAKILVVCTAKDLVNRSCKPIGNSDLGFVARSQARLQFAVLGPVKRSALLLSAVGGLDQEFSEVWVAVAAP